MQRYEKEHYSISQLCLPSPLKNDQEKMTHIHHQKKNEKQVYNHTTLTQSSYDLRESKTAKESVQAPNPLKKKSCDLRETHTAKASVQSHNPHVKQL